MFITQKPVTWGCSEKKTSKMHERYSSSLYINTYDLYVHPSDAPAPPRVMPLACLDHRATYYTWTTLFFPTPTTPYAYTQSHTNCHQSPYPDYFPQHTRLPRGPGQPPSTTSIRTRHPIKSVRRHVVQNVVNWARRISEVFGFLFCWRHLLWLLKGLICM